MIRYKREQAESQGYSDYGRYGSSRNEKLTLRQSLPSLPGVLDLERNRRDRAVAARFSSPLKKSASALNQNGWRFIPENLEDPALSKYMTPQQLHAKAAQMEHDKAVDALVRRIVNEDHIADINEFDIRKKVVVWGL